MSRRGENIHKRKDGRWEGRYIKSYDITGKAKYGSVYAKTYLEVKHKLIKINEKILNNALPSKEKKISFREVLNLWLENSRLNLKPQTYAKYLYMIENHILPVVGTIILNSIDAAYINKLLIEKSTNGRLDGNGGLSPSYIRMISFIIKSTIEYAVKEGYCAPISGDIIQPLKKKQELEILSINEQLKLEGYLMCGFDDRKLGTLLSLYTGLRIGEVCGLRWGDIDFDSKTIHVQHTVERISNFSEKHGDRKTILVFGDAKSISSNRIIPIPSKILDILQKYEQSDDTFVLRGKRYDYTDPRAYQYSFHSYLEACKIRSVNYHALRHTFATRCIESGMDIKSLSEILGHASVNITLNTYVHSSLEHKRNQLDIMTTYCGQK